MRLNKKKLSMLSLVLLLVCLFGPSSAELKPTQPPVTCTSVRRPEGTTYQLSRLDWSPECMLSWETEDHLVLARGSNLHKDMVVEVTNQSITLKDCQEYLRFQWLCSNVREEVICQGTHQNSDVSVQNTAAGQSTALTHNHNVNCSLPLTEEIHTPQENITMKWCLNKNFCLDTLHFVLGLVFIVFGPPAAIFAGVCIWMRKKTCTMQRREEEAEADQRKEDLMMRPFPYDQVIQQIDETEKENNRDPLLFNVWGK